MTYPIAGNFRLEKIFVFFAQARQIFLARYFTQWKICHVEIFTRTNTWLSSGTNMISNQLFFKSSSCSLAWCRYWRTSTLHLGLCPILRDPYRRSYRHRRGQHLRVSIFHTSRKRSCRGSCALHSGRGVFIRELHPLLPSEQLGLWAKFFMQVWALSEIFIQRKFCYTNELGWRPLYKLSSWRGRGPRKSYM